MANAVYPALPEHVRSAQEWILPGWEQVSGATGDLNGDGRADVALVTWPKGELDRLQARSWTAYNYQLVIGFADGSGGFRKIVDDHAILSAPDTMNNPPATDEAVAIKSGVLDLSRELLRGHTRQRLRWDGRDFRQIGYDQGYSDGRCVTVTSMNFLTRRATIMTAGLRMAGKERHFKRRLKRGPITLTEASAEGYYPEQDIIGPATYCIHDGERL